MYTIKQAQGMDYLLKKILWNISSKDGEVNQQKLKLLVEVNGDYWYGDFLNIKDTRVLQNYIDEFGDLEIKYFDHTTEDNLLAPVWARYIDDYENTNKIFKYSNELVMKFHQLVKVMDSVVFRFEGTPFYPYLLNATLFTNREVKLPFIAIENEVNIVSLIKVD